MRRRWPEAAGRFPDDLMTADSDGNGGSYWPIKIHIACYYMCVLLRTRDRNLYEKTCILTLVCLFYWPAVSVDSIKLRAWFIVIFDVYDRILRVSSTENYVFLANILLIILLNTLPVFDSLRNYRKMLLTNTVKNIFFSLDAYFTRQRVI